MTTVEKRRRYQAFFQGDEVGKGFMAKLQSLIEANYTRGENDPNLARDYLQRAKGVREVIEHIQSLTAERSQDKQPKS